METIRPARPEDCAFLADLILISDSGLLSALFPGGPRTTLTHLASHPGNPFSYEHGWVVDFGGEVIGAVVGSGASEVRHETLSTAALILRYYGIRAPRRFLQLLRAGVATEGLDATDYYVNNIAVFPAWRRKGYGTQLLLSVEETMKGRGARRIILDVDPKNEEATALYRRLGYVEERTVSIVLSPREVYHYRRFWKVLPPLGAGG